jgi:hypothetical protein
LTGKKHHPPPYAGLVSGRVKRKLGAANMSVVHQ